MSIRKRSPLSAVILTLFLIVGAFASSGAMARSTLKIASFNVGGSWYIYAETIAKLAGEQLGDDYNIEVLPYQGGVGNPMLVNRGKADLGLSFSALSNWAYNGIVAFDEKQSDIRALVGGLNNPHRLGIVAREDLGIDSLQDIKDKKMSVRLVTVQVGGAGEALARMALEAYGMSYEDIEKWGGSVTHTDLPVALQRMRDGQADLFIHNIGYRQPDVMELAIGTSLDFIPLGKEQRESLVKQYGFEPGLAIKKGEFEGVEKDIPSIGYPTGVIASKDLPNDVAYQITKAICEHPDKLADAHASLKAFDPEEAADSTKNGGIPLHPGARKYYKEQGLL
ncbi:TAXI family TRAP transporter solute-binding subunit [Arhodomonas aquaeolei]|uniref:TAXI family TRAP transporter solute-binding subunit n=1 Tax=Arhodomonas aquaeolei TaxID=2369 RepID=UPI00216753B1|nr:TAXI family TRAP transporter solute-binding subunit [Arhodomonas aquaeolei]MCS4505871.1 TAXI family TRAP transporter solute-binding subunit [Arhodomonas aquaeolei]